MKDVFIEKVDKIYDECKEIFTPHNETLFDYSLMDGGERERFFACLSDFLCNKDKKKLSRMRNINSYNVNMICAMLENLVYLELKRRGYDVYIGKLNDKDIDFIASKREEKIYVQVCEKMPSNSTREIDNLSVTKDQYHKYVVTLDELSEGNKDGIQILPIVKFFGKREW